MTETEWQDKIRLMDQYYCLQLDDYAAPSFASWSKPYYGTLADIRCLVDALAGDGKDHGLSITELVDGLHDYEAGNRNVTHHVAYQVVPLLEPVELLGEEVLHLEGYQWEHRNTWGCPYKMRCDRVRSRHLWLNGPEGICRVVMAEFENLRYEGMSGLWVPLLDGFWGFPMMLASEGTRVRNRLAVTEKRFPSLEAARQNMAAFQPAQDVDFTAFCQDVFGNG